MIEIATITDNYGTAFKVAPLGALWSDAHEIIQRKDGSGYVCARCGKLNGTHIFPERCRWHLEDRKSGYGRNEVRLGKLSYDMVEA